MRDRISDIVFAIGQYPKGRRAVGLLALLLSLGADLAHKYWMLFVFDISTRQPVPLGPWMDMILAWNFGVSYSLLQTHSDLGRYGLIGFTVLATTFMALWLWRAKNLMSAIGLGMIIGGALGNIHDRVRWGAVADFFHFHIGSFSWYVFNIADVAIVLGTVLLLVEALFFTTAKQPSL